MCAWLCVVSPCRLCVLIAGHFEVQRFVSLPSPACSRDRPAPQPEAHADQQVGQGCVLQDPDDKRKALLSAAGRGRHRGWRQRRGRGRAAQEGLVARAWQESGRARVDLDRGPRADRGPLPRPGRVPDRPKRQGRRLLGRGQRCAAHRPFAEGRLPFALCRRQNDLLPRQRGCRAPRHRRCPAHFFFELSRAAPSKHELYQKRFSSLLCRSSDRNSPAGRQEQEPVSSQLCHISLRTRNIQNTSDRGMIDRLPRNWPDQPIQLRSADARASR